MESYIMNKKEEIEDFIIATLPNTMPDGYTLIESHISRTD
jgi:hypothetical protein